MTPVFPVQLSQVQILDLGSPLEAVYGVFSWFQLDSLLSTDPSLLRHAVSPCPSLVARALVCHIPVPGVAFAEDIAHSGLWEAPGGDKHKSQLFPGLRRPG